MHQRTLPKSTSHQRLRLLRSRQTVARLIVSFPDRGQELMLVFDRLEDELAQDETRHRKLERVHELATRATLDNSSRT